MSLTAKMQDNFYSHHTYVKDDFTKEEIERENKLATAVIEHELAVCKTCGRFEQGLYDHHCRESTKND